MRFNCFESWNVYHENIRLSDIESFQSQSQSTSVDALVHFELCSLFAFLPFFSFLQKQNNFIVLKSDFLYFCTERKLRWQPTHATRSTMSVILKPHQVEEETSEQRYSSSEVRSSHVLVNASGLFIKKISTASWDRRQEQKSRNHVVGQQNKT